MYKMGGMMMKQRILSFIGWVVACFMALSGSFLAWLMPLLDLEPRLYLWGCFAVSVVLAAWIERGADQDER